MKVNVDVPEWLVKHIKETFEKACHQEMTDEQLTSFLSVDIIELYSDAYSEDLRDALITMFHTIYYRNR
jgi:hypothetical protein